MTTSILQLRKSSEQIAWNQSAANTGPDNRAEARFAQRRPSMISDPFERAITKYNNELQSYAQSTERVHPNDYAQVHLRLGCAYNRRIQGGKAQNLTLGIHNLQKCVQHLERHPPTLKAHRKEWAAAHLELGNAYTEIPRGDR